jgi:hypothetical protein
MENDETQNLIEVCETLSQTIVTEDGVLNTLLLNISFRLKELYNENQSLIKLLLDNKVIERVQEPTNIIAFPAIGKKS